MVLMMVGGGLVLWTVTAETLVEVCVLLERKGVGTVGVLVVGLAAEHETV